MQQSKGRPSVGAYMNVLLGLTQVGHALLVLFELFLDVGGKGATGTATP